MLQVAQGQREARNRAPDARPPWRVAAAVPHAAADALDAALQLGEVEAVRGGHDDLDTPLGPATADGCRLALGVATAIAATALALTPTALRARREE